MTRSVSSELYDLLKLRDRGVLTPAQFEEQKARVLAEDPALVMDTRPPLSSRISKRTTHVLAFGGMAIIAAIGLTGLMPDQSHTQSPAAITERKPDAATVAPAPVAKMDAGQYCLSPFSGADPSFVDTVKADLRDPDSFEHIATRVDPVDKSGLHPIMMEFRSRNGFGGMNVSIATGHLNDSTCDATLDRITR